MASFDVKPPEQQVPNYTGASRGIQASANTALGTLFDGLARTLDTGVKEADRQVKEDIRNDIFDEVDAVQAEFGVPEATDIQADPNASLRPTQLQAAGEQLDRLQSAYQRGALKESHYWARMNSMVRQLRGKYPGYRAEIDGMVSSITGARPANALRNALFNEWQSATSSDPLPKMEDWAIKNGYLPYDYFQRQQTGDAYSYTELASYVAQKNKQEVDTAAERQALALEMDLGKATDKQAERTFINEINRISTTLLQDTQTSLGKDFSSIQDTFKRFREGIARGDPASAAEVEQMRGSVGQVRDQLRLALQQVYMQPLDPANPKNSYSTMIDKSTADQIIENAMLPIDLYVQALDSEDPTAVAGSMAAWLKAQSTQAGVDLVKDIPFLSMLQAAREILGPDAFGLYLNAHPKFQSELTAVLADHQANQAVTGNGSMGQALADGQKNDMDKEYYTALIDRWTGMVDQIGKGIMPEEAIRNNVKFMFGQGSGQVLAMLDDASRFEYFNRVASPIVSKKMLSLKESGDLESWQYYQSWVANGFMTLFKQSVDDLQRMNTDPRFEGVQVTWDSKNLSFKFKADPTVFGTPLGSIIPGPGNATTFGTSGDIGGEINAVIRNMAPIFDANDADSAKEIYTLLQSMGFNPTAEREGTLIGSMMRALGESLKTNDLKARGSVTVPIMDARNGL